jgi:hypothetical protein
MAPRAIMRRNANTIEAPGRTRHMTFTRVVNTEEFAAILFLACSVPSIRTAVVSGRGNDQCRLVRLR